MSLYKYISVTKLVDMLKSKIDSKRKATHALVFFEGKNASVDKYNKICVKPLYIQINSGSEIIQKIEYAEILQMYNKIVVLSFSQNYHRQIPDKIHMYNLIIQFTPSIFTTPDKKQITYYETELYKCLMDNVIKKVRNQSSLSHFKQ